MYDLNELNWKRTERFISRTVLQKHVNPIADISLGLVSSKGKNLQGVKRRSTMKQRHRWVLVLSEPEPETQVGV